MVWLQSLMKTTSLIWMTTTSLIWMTRCKYVAMCVYCTIYELYLVGVLFAFSASEDI